MTLQAKPPKPRACKVCKASFTPQRMGAKVCSAFCAMTFVRLADAKTIKIRQVIEKRETRQKLNKLKTRGDRIREAQVVFNVFIRTRDAGRACICCGRNRDPSWAIGGIWDAGHYRSRGSAPHLRFDARNVHAQLKQCNRYDSGNVVGYRLGLIERIGQTALDELEADQTPRRHTIPDLQAIKAEYAAKTKALKHAQELCA